MEYAESCFAWWEGVREVGEEGDKMSVVVDAGIFEKVGLELGNRTIPFPVKRRGRGVLYGKR